MFEHRVSSRYAKAMLDMAADKGMAKDIYDEFENVSLTLNMSRELRSLTASPVFQLNKKKKIFQEIFRAEHISDEMLDFLLLLIDKRRGELILSIAHQYKKQYDVRNNRLPVDITSAVELDDNKRKEVTEKLAAMTKKTILPNFCINRNLIGGILVRVDDWVYDFTVKNQLKQIHLRLSEGRSIN